MSWRKFHVICTSIQEKDFKKCINMLNHYDFAEIRNDLCGFNKEQIAELTLRHPNIIMTERYNSSQDNFALKTAILNGVKYIDMEIEYPQKDFEEIRELASKHECKLIVSYHNYTGTPNLDELKSIVLKCASLGADIVKIVTTANNISDASRTLELYKYKLLPKGSLVAFCMGDAGKFTRYISLFMGAPYSYAAPNDNNNCLPTASGQYTVNELINLLKRSKIELLKFPENFNHNISITIPCSKSIAQRAIVGAILAKGKTILKNFSLCNDIIAAMNIAKQLGCKISEESQIIHGEAITNLIIKSPGAKAIKDSINGKEILFNIGESGLLTRIMMPLLGYFNNNSDSGTSIKITGNGSILGRDMSSTINALSVGGIECSCINRNNAGDFLPCSIHNSLILNNIEISGKDSSQIVSGYLMMLPLLKNDSVLKVNEPKSTPYINLTLNILLSYGITIKCEQRENSHIYYIKGGFEYNPCTISMDSDWSSASYFLVMWAIAGSKFITNKNNNILKINNLKTNSNQADEAILEVLKDCGCNIIVNKDSISIGMNKPLKNFNFDATNSPDLFPILATLACYCNETSSIKGVKRLAQKESNRAESIYTEFTKLGANIRIVEDFMYICKEDDFILHGGDTHSHNDHRIAMSIATAALFIKDAVTIDDIKCIDKSFPLFMEKLKFIIN